MDHRISASTPLHSLRLSFSLAFITMAGLSYVNFLPALVESLVTGVGLSPSHAGEIFAVNGYGGLVGTVLAIFFVKHISWKPVMMGCLILLGIFDVTSPWFEQHTWILLWRFAAGFLGGLSLGIGFSVLGRLANPNQSFGCLLFIQFAIGSIVIYLTPLFNSAYGNHSLFYVMAALASISVLLLNVLPKIQLRSTGSLHCDEKPFSITNAALLLMSIGCYQTAASSIWAYISLIGTAANIASQDVSLYVAASGLLGLGGAMIAIFIHSSAARIAGLISGVALSWVCAIALVYASIHPWIYIAAISGLFFLWPMINSYLFAVSADMDTSGRLATTSAVVSSVGLASGPLLASYWVSNNSYHTLLFICAYLFAANFIFILKLLNQQRPLNTKIMNKHKPLNKPASKLI